MNKYTFIAEYRGGTYISQFKAKGLDLALIEWAKNLNKKYFSPHKKAKIIEEIKNNDFPPLPINGVDNVWSSNYFSGKFFLLLNIIETI